MAVLRDRIDRLKSGHGRKTAARTPTKEYPHRTAAITGKKGRKAVMNEFAETGRIDHPPVHAFDARPAHPMKLFILYAFAFSLVGAGCSSTSGKASRNFPLVRLGMTYDEVVSLVGLPRRLDPKGNARWENHGMFADYGEELHVRFNEGGVAEWVKRSAQRVDRRWEAESSSWPAQQSPPLAEINGEPPPPRTEVHRN
ncbi:MAG: hypothetical protein ABIZ49_01910 [Opitutaceae bacterium]